MKIGIDTRPLKFAQTGLKTYLSELVNEWNISKGVEIVLLEPSRPVYNGNNKLIKILEHIKFIWWKEYQLPKAAVDNNCTHLFCADFFVPYKKKWGAVNLKTIAVLHDAFFGRIRNIIILFGYNYFILLVYLRLKKPTC